eukprot:scaffold1057_cov459-Prasinococcus_capsulatus_cf.AAC.8
MQLIHWGKPAYAIPLFLKPDSLIDAKGIYTIAVSNIERAVAGDDYFPKQFHKTSALTQLAYAYKSRVAIVNENTFSLIMTDSAISNCSRQFLRKYVMSHVKVYAAGVLSRSLT